MAKFITKIIGILGQGCYTNGTGFTCSDSGHILTSAHNITNCTVVRVYFKHKLFDATVLCVDNRIDVALLKIDTTTAPIVFESIVQYGMCYTYGYHHDQMSLAYQEGTIMTLNYVSAHCIDSTLTTLKGFKGASGSPVFNKHDKVVSILNFDSNIGSGGVVSRLLQSFVTKTITQKIENCIILQKSHSGFITCPLSIHDILENNIVQLYDYIKGERVVKILHKKSEIKCNDIIVSINENTVGNGNISIESFVLYTKPGTVISVKYLKYNKHTQSYDTKFNQCKIKTLAFPSLYDKPLDTSNMLNLNFTAKYI